MRWPLRRQILIPVLAVAIASLTALGTANVYFAERQTSDRIERQIQGVAAVLSSTNFPLTDRVLEQMQALSRAEFVVESLDGAPQAASRAFSLENLPRSPEAIATNEFRLGPPIDLDGRAYFHTAVRLPARAVGEGGSLLHVLFPVDEFRRTWRAAFMPPLIVGLLTIAMVAIVARIIGYRLARATAQLEGEVLRIARGDFSPAPLPTTDDEILDLAQAVNRTAEMLAEYEQQVRRTEQMRTVALLGAGLAHEMRNAATGCRMALDLHAEQCVAQNDSESLFVAKRQLRLMESQLQRFLRAGQPSNDAEKRPVSFTALVDDALSLVRPSARHARVSLAWNPPDTDVELLADAEALSQVVLNLLINAIEAAQQCGLDERREIVVTLNKLDRAAELLIADTGPGPKSTVESALFEPFVTSKAEGVGLGLAVAREAVEAHHGTIDWRRMDGRTIFRVVFPASEKGEVSG
jgi:signal transduction histidine kinase